MRRLSFVIACAVLCASGPAGAGSLNYADGRAEWRSSVCQAPVAPSALGHDAEAAANDLNAKWVAHNQYATAVESYMKCVSDEATRDASAASSAVTQAAQAEIAKAHAAVEADAAALAQKPAR
jgi:hypothetical protein